MHFGWAQCVALCTFHFCFVRYLILTLIFEFGTRSYTRREIHNALVSVLRVVRFFYFVLIMLLNFFGHHSIIIIIQQTNTSIRETIYLEKYLEQVMIYCRINVLQSSKCWNRSNSLWRRRIKRWQNPSQALDNIMISFWESFHQVKTRRRWFLQDIKYLYLFFFIIVS